VNTRTMGVCLQSIFCSD